MKLIQHKNKLFLNLFIHIFKKGLSTTKKYYVFSGLDSNIAESNQFITVSVIPLLLPSARPRPAIKNIQGSKVSPSKNGLCQIDVRSRLISINCNKYQFTSWFINPGVKKLIRLIRACNSLDELYDQPSNIQELARPDGTSRIQQHKSDSQGG